MRTPRQRRVGSGVPQGGEFAATTLGEASSALRSTPDFLSSASRLALLETTTDTNQLWDAVHDPDVSMRIAVLANPSVTDEQLDELTDPATQPFLVRHTAAFLPRQHSLRRTSRDPNPLVRAVAGVDPRRDADVGAVVEALACWASA